MKKIITLILITLVTLTSSASEKNARKAASALCKITVYDKDNNITNTGCGIFTSDGIGVSSMSLFKGSHRATATDTKGHTHEITRICGTDEIYDVIKFRVDGSTPYTTTSSEKAEGIVWSASYNEGKPKIHEVTIDKCETFMEKYTYYIINSGTINEGCALISDNGKIAALIQKSPNGAVHATDAAFIQDLKTYGLSINNPAVKCCDIPLQLPDTKEEALLMMILSGNMNDEAQHEASVSEFISVYPDMPDGYMERAKISAQKKDYASADKDLSESVRKADKKAEFYFNYSRTIFRCISADSTLNYSSWTSARAYELAEKAVAADDQPVYRQLMAQISFASKDFSKAYDTYMDIVKDGRVYPDAYYGAAQCKIMLDAPKEEIIVLLDSAVNSCDSVNYKISAPYVFLRASIYTEMGEYRKAVTDYYRYEILNNGEMNAQFYYLREQTELKAKMYQQALNDIHKAIFLAPDEVLYYAEAGALELKVKMFEEAEAMARKCISMAPDYSQGYLILSLALKYQGKEKESEEALNKAKEIDSRASDIDKDTH